VKFFRELPAETRKARNLVTLGYDHVDRQTHAKNLLCLPEFLVKTGCFLLELGAAFVSQLSVAQKIRTRNRDHETVERALRPVLLQQAQDSVPATMTRRSVLAQHEVTGHVEHDAFVEEIPIQLPVVFIDELFY
jgi:hypothetical protein